MPVIDPPRRRQTGLQVHRYRVPSRPGPRSVSNRTVERSGPRGRIGARDERRLTPAGYGAMNEIGATDNETGKLGAAVAIFAAQQE